MNIIDAILFQCRINAEQPAICAPGTRFDLVTYAQLEYMLNNVTRALLPLGLQRGDVVGILSKDKIFHAALMLALMRIGVVTVSCSGPSLPPEIGAVAIISDSSEPVTGVKRVIRANPDWIKGSADRVVDLRLLSANGDDVCRIVLTSGTTGEPKGVAWSHRLVIERNLAQDCAFGSYWPQASRVYCDLGLGSGVTYRFLVRMLMRGGMVMFYGEDPMSTEQSLDLFKIQNMVTSPRGLAEHLKFYESINLRCHLDQIIVAGGSVSPNLLDRVWSRMCRNIFNDYGSTEAGTVASGDLRIQNQPPGAAGHILPGAEVEIVDEMGRPFGLNQEGIIRARTPYMANGYVGQPHELALSFREGWFYPGDNGYMTDEGLLVVTGRQDARINVGGDKINPELIEEVLMSFPGIRDAAVLSVANTMGVGEAHALIQADGLADNEALRTHCKVNLSRDFVPVHFVVVERIPRSQSGKIERGQLLELLKTKLA